MQPQGRRRHRRGSSVHWDNPLGVVYVFHELDDDDWEA